jgi:hypothetical protein
MQLVRDIQNEIMRGVLSFQDIAFKYEVTYSDVETIALEMNAMVTDNDYFDDFDFME